MEDSFKVRVDRAFGTLQASSSSSNQSTSSSLNSLWCLTDEEIERNRWIQDKIDPHRDNDELIHRLKNPKPYSPFLQGLLAEPSTSGQDLEADIEELDDDDDGGEDDEENRQPQLSKPDDHSHEEWDIRSSVGMDCTLDNEEEEDAYDKVAIGNEESADRFYMKAVNDYEFEIDSNNELPSSFTDVIRDPRANHKAAKLRLKEDDESARKLGLEVSVNNIQESNQIATELKEHIARATFREPLSSSTIPDHVLNPSKYTHYTFDSMDDIDEESNRKAYMEFFNSLRRSSGMEMQDDVSTGSATSIIFTPRKESSDASMKKNEGNGYENKKVPISFVADSEVCMMDEDEPEIAANGNRSLQKGDRRYRTKGSTHVE